MKAILGGLVLSLFVTMMVVPADAKGCIKGAVVGGAAGHMAGHHGLLGAAAGCAIGHHEARKNEKAVAVLDCDFELVALKGDHTSAQPLHCHRGRDGVTLRSGNSAAPTYECAP